MVTRLDRLARSTRDLLNTLAAITGKKAGFRSLGDTWADTTTSHGRLMLTVLGGLAEFERDLIRARTGEGRERAKARGVKMGRKPKLTPHQQARRSSGARQRRADPGHRPHLQRPQQHDFAPRAMMAGSTRKIITMQSVDETGVRQYTNVMTEIKRRSRVVHHFMGAQNAALYMPTTTETIGLQFRKIFELIAFASLSANKKLYAAAYANFAKHWEASKLIANLHRINPDFYPVPIVITLPLNRRSPLYSLAAPTDS